MTDSEKLDLILSEMQDLKQTVTGLDQTVTGLDQKVTGLEKDMINVKSDLDNLKSDMTVVKSDLKQLQRDANFILDEVERVHSILDIHKADKSVHNSMTVIK